MATLEQRLDFATQTWSDDAGVYGYWSHAPVIPSARRKYGVKAAESEHVWLVRHGSQDLVWALVHTGTGQILHRLEQSVA